MCPCTVSLYKHSLSTSKAPIFTIQGLPVTGQGLSLLGTIGMGTLTHPFHEVRGLPGILFEHWHEKHQET